jgi:hypothetical protein
LTEVDPTNGNQIGSTINASVSAGISTHAGCGSDKQWLVADRFASSPGKDNLYLAWMSCNGMSFSRSTNHGLTWSTAVTVTDAVDNGTRMIHDAVGADGAVYVAYHSGPSGYTNEEVPDGTTGKIIVRRSDDYGLTFPAANKWDALVAGDADMSYNFQFVCTASDTQGRCTAGNASHRKLDGTRAMMIGSAQPWLLPDPTDANKIAVVASDDPTNTLHGGTADDTRVVIARSTNRGATWSAASQVDSGTGTTMQLMPTAAPDLNSSCISVAYYDSRRGLSNANGRALLDLMVRTSADGGITWGPEVRINDDAFDPDIGSGEYGAGAAPPPNTPPGYLPTMRVGEYNGVLMGRGVIWTGNVAGQNLQETKFDLSDGIAPVVATPAPKTVYTCRPSAASLGTTTATDTCGVPPLSTPAPSFGTLTRGSNAVTWSARDGADNVGYASQTVTVNDTTPPVILAPPAVQVALCGQATVTVGLPSGSDDCGGSLSYTGQVISKNGTPLSPPIAVTNGQVSLPAGSYVVQWTGSDGINTSSPVLQTVTVLPKIQTADTFILDDSAFIKDSSGQPGLILNSGNGITRVGVAATSGSITSYAAVDVRNQAKVTGNVTSHGLVTAPPGTVTGTITQNAAVVLPGLPALPAFPPPSGGNITVNNTTQTLTPGSYPTVTLNSGATLIMTAGDFYFQNLFINSNVNVKVQVTPNTRVFVQNQFTFSSPFVNSGGTLQPILLGFAGANLVVQTTFSGTLLAPNAFVTFGIGAGINYLGSFYAKSIEVRNNSTLTCNLNATPALPTNPRPTSCTNGIKDGFESDIDCGGSVCGACSNGRTCSIANDCLSGSCSGGICQAPAGQFTARLSVYTDWGSGYCANLVATNGASSPTTNWAAVIDTKQSSIYTSWNGSFSGAAGVLNVAPSFSWNKAIAPGTSNQTVGFCANRTPANSGAVPSLLSASATY